MVTLIIKGGNIELSPVEGFTKVKRRIQAAKKNRLDYELGNSENFDVGASTEIMFFTDITGDDDDEQQTGRVFVDIGDVIGCMSDEYKDGGGSVKPEKPEDDEDDEEVEED